MAKRKTLPIFLCCLLSVILTGCWDQKNIEEHGFVVGSAIDLAEDQTKEHVNIALTNQLVIPGQIGTPEQGGGEEKAFLNLTSEGESMFNINRHMASQTSRIPFYEHLKVLIVSEELAEKPQLLASLMDFFIRDHEMRRGVHVFISEGNAKDILQIDPKPERIPAIFLDTITENEQELLEMTQPVEVGKLHGLLLGSKSYVLPKISAQEDKSKVYDDKTAVFHGFNNQMVGTLTGEETKGLNLLTEKNDGGSIKFEIDNKLMTYETTGTNVKVDIDTTDLNSLGVSINIMAEGGVAEMFGDRSLLDEAYIAKIEEKVAERIEQLANKTINKAQGELNADVLNIGNILQQRHYPLWKKMEGDWENGKNYFSKVRIDVSAEVNVRQTGVTDRAKDREH